MMAEGEIRKFIIGALCATGVGKAERDAVVDAVTTMWISDRQVAEEEARDAIYEDVRDSWNVS